MSDTKTVKEVVGEAATAGAEVEMNVMYMGAPTQTPVVEGQKGMEKETEAGAGAVADPAVEEAPIAQGSSGEAVLETKEFWDDLQGFVLQRLRDEEVTANIMRGFRESWRASRS